MVVGQDADPAAILETAVPDLDPVGIGDADDIAPDGFECAVVNGRSTHLAGIEPDQEILRILRPAAGIPLEMESVDVHLAELAGREVEHGRGHRTFRGPLPHQSETRALPSIQKVAVDVVGQSRPFQMLSRKI